MQVEAYKEYGITLLRVMLAIVFLMHGYLAAFVLTPAGLTAFNASNGIPFPAAVTWVVIVGHLLGGLLLLSGAYTRLGAVVNLLVMAGAVWFIHLKQGFFMKGFILDSANGRAVAGGYEYGLVLFVATAAILFLGSGPLSVDKARRRAGRNTT